MNNAATLATCLLCLVFLASCSDIETESADRDESANSIEVGGIYTSQQSDGSWGVVKVLALDEGIVHIRAYANSYPEQPTDIDPAELTLGGLDDPNGFGIGHLPLATEGFLQESPVLIKVVEVEEDELDGYRAYLEAMGE